MNVGDSRAIVAQNEPQDVGSSVYENELSTEAIIETRLTVLQLSTDHSTSIEEEVIRIKNEHPDDNQCIVKDRVKGRLLPGIWKWLKVKTSVREGLGKARERSFVFKEALSDMAKFYPKSISKKKKKKEDNRNVLDHSGKQALPSKKREGGDAEESTKTCIHSSIADEDYTPIDPQIQNLVKKVDECIAKFDQKRQVLQDAIESDIEAVKKDQRETRELRKICIGIALGLAAGSLWKMHHWNEQRKVRSFYDLLEKVAADINE
ncbi:hypothetical protein DKX38_000545 [Salix brachista]|uniref:PPM-type phosphatase domain-containing protein n=1 Tax=Salix brachista TaxID=2182728 RepID=A0A5N5P3Q5_9ROSI|nr:hypothetical protein DKX38_000545 [Salix brachista]